MLSSLGFLTRGSGYRYTLLGARPSTKWIPRRRNCLLLCGLVLIACAGVAVLSFVDFETLPVWAAPKTPSIHDLPPVYSLYHERELQLPQQQWNRTKHEEHEKLFYVSGPLTDGGWGFAFQEHLLHAYLAYRLGRTFVFDNYTLKRENSGYTRSFGYAIPSEIPYTALIRGPMVGELWGPGYNHVAPAVTKTYFDRICTSRTNFFVYDLYNNVKIEQYRKADMIVNAWSDWTNRVHEIPCVEAWGGPIFDHWQTFDIPGSLDPIWPDLISTPLLTRFSWSPLIELAFDTNRDLFFPALSLARTPYLSALPYNTSASAFATTLNAARYPPIPGLMAIHVPKAHNYAAHCTFVADNGAPFVSVNAFSSLPDAATGIPDRTNQSPGEGTTSPSRREAAALRRRCYPSIPGIVAKVRAVRATAASAGVRLLHIMTDGGPAYAGRLKRALWDAFPGEWDSVSSSEDLVLNWEQRFVSEAVDALVAQRAQVFIGNGFSMLTANAVIMRLANNFSTESTRFW
uniref:MkkA n=1 Tax=Ganoderma boninense TaxID=34458 RepID=A0A5K1K6B7_9APHY|nr:MkkA [Ganoderma boninense]